MMSGVNFSYVKLTTFSFEKQTKKLHLRTLKLKMQSRVPNIDETKWLYRLAFRLAVFTIIYNIAEGFIAAYFGYEDESMTLFGFGLDSFIEALSGLGIAHMILR